MRQGMQLRLHARAALHGFARRPHPLKPTRPSMPHGDDVTARVRRMAGQRGKDQGYQGEPWEAVLRRDPCSWCGGTAGTIDHIVPRSQGGPRGHRVWNSTAACRGCNESRGSLSPLAFLYLRSIGELLQAAHAPTFAAADSLSCTAAPHVAPRLEDWSAMPEFTASPTGESLSRRVELLVWHCSNPYEVAIEGNAAEVRRDGELVDDDEAERLVMEAFAW